MPIVDNLDCIVKNNINRQIRDNFTKKKNEEMWSLLIHLNCRGGKKNSLNNCIPIEIGFIIWSFFNIN